MELVNGPLDGADLEVAMKEGEQIALGISVRKSVGETDVWCHNVNSTKTVAAYRLHAERLWFVWMERR